MKREHGFTLMETLVAIALIVILCGMGLSGWQRWQAQQRLWQTALQARHFLERLRDDANGLNRSQRVYGVHEGGRWCLANTPVQTCEATGPFVLTPDWSEVTLVEVTPSLGFYGLRNSAWPGHIHLRSDAGEWRIVVSTWGRIRMCQQAVESLC
ncbi:prepilin peptidase-dependent protein [Kosakonia oryzendophytica]|uniref:prepilin peptidase-dependent protein n=1 Tax=Kosakonia oryzendophytica TaxID=1005665 RepID=UPI003D347FBA